MKLLIMQFSPASCHLLLGPNIFLIPSTWITVSDL